MREKVATIYDVAQLSGVSIATVSRVMSGGSVSETSRRKVEEAMEALRYTPSPSATHKQERRQSRSLALVCSDLSNPYFSALASGAEKEARDNGYSLSLYTPPAGEGAGIEIVGRMIVQKHDGAVLVGNIIENGVEGELLEMLVRLQRIMPLVIIGPRIEALACTTITSDLSLSVKRSLAHLYALGHRRIAFIGGSRIVRSSHIREDAFYTEMERLGLQADRSLHVETGYTPQDGEICITKLFARTSPQKRPTAIIAINDLVALGALRQLQRMNLRVPQDIALIGCDNQFFTPYLSPPLTTVDLHPADHGRHAISELIAVQGGGSPITYSQVRECSLIVRESCGASLGPRQLG